MAKLEDEAPAIISDHKFKPKSEWWSLCQYCNLAESAHTETELLYYGDDNEDSEEEPVSVDLEPEPS